MDTFPSVMIGSARPKKEAGEERLGIPTIRPTRALVRLPYPNVCRNRNGIKQWQMPRSAKMRNHFVWISIPNWGVFGGKFAPTPMPFSKAKTYIWAISAELDRKCGHRRDKQNVPLGKADAKVDQLSSDNQRMLGEQINESKRVRRITPPGKDKPSYQPNVKRECYHPQNSPTPECIPEYEAVIHENPAIPAAPKDFGNFDFAILEDKARALWFADDKWVINGNQITDETYGEDTLSNRQMAIQK